MVDLFEDDDLEEAEYWAASVEAKRVLTAAVLADPEAVATVVSALAKREQVGKFGRDRWAPVHAGIVSLADLIRAREE